MRRSLLIGVLAASCVALTFAAPAAMAARPGATITRIEGYSDGPFFENNVTSCSFHVTVTFTTTGHVPRGGYRLVVGLFSGTTLISAPVSGSGASPFVTETIYALSENVTGEDLNFSVEMFGNGPKLVTSAKTDSFAPTLADSGCPAASSTPLVTSPSL